MKWKLIAIVFIFSQCVYADQSGVAAKDNQVLVDESILRTNAALKSYQNDYLKQPQNKAFAQSPDGSWAWRTDRVTVEMAKTDALAACNRGLNKNESPCEIVNVNGEWITSTK